MTSSSRRYKRTVQRFLNKGCRQSYGASYKPWIDVQDSSFSGERRPMLPTKTIREGQFLSVTELDIFLLLELANDAMGIREQFPLGPGLTP